MNDYVYRLNKKTPTKKYWSCTFSGCNIFVHTDVNNNYFCGGTNEHGHAPNPELIEVRQTRTQIKQRGATELKSIGMIYDEEMSKTTMNPTYIAVFPTVDEICKPF